MTLTDGSTESRPTKLDSIWRQFAQVRNPSATIVCRPEAFDEQGQVTLRLNLSDTSG